MVNLNVSKANNAANVSVFGADNIDTVRRLPKPEERYMSKRDLHNTDSKPIKTNAS